MRSSSRACTATGRQDPAPIGAEAGLAVPRPDGGVELYVASTDPHTDRDTAAACYGLEPERVKVVVTRVSGATADREDQGFQLPLGLLALRPAAGEDHRDPRGVLPRSRPPAPHPPALPPPRRRRASVKVEAQILLDAGAYADTSVAGRRTAVSFACGPSSSRTPSIEGWAVRTNNPALRPCARRGRHAGLRRL